MEEKIRIENVTKKFGSYAALDGISLSFEKGKIHGMIGRNGSGKTVLFKCICGFLRVDDGAVFVDGKQIGKEIEAPESIGANVGEKARQIFPAFYVCGRGIFKPDTCQRANDLQRGSRHQYGCSLYHHASRRNYPGKKVY